MPHLGRGTMICATTGLKTATIDLKYDGLSRLIGRKVTRGVDQPEVEVYQWDGWKLIMIAKLNTDGTFHSRIWASAAENTIRVGIPAAAGGAAYGGYQLGEEIGESIFGED
jgi:hypothetical protein